MGYIRVFRRVRLAPGVTLNLAKRGPSVSFGVRRAHVTLGRTGIRRTVGLPGTGVFYTAQSGWHSGLHSAPAFRESTQGWQRDADLLFAVIVIVVAFAILAVLTR
jgi:hypothetical protein